MERKKIEIYLPYFEDGEEKKKCFTISFISNRMDREYREIMTQLAEIVQLGEQHKLLMEKQARAFANYSIKDLANLKAKREEYKSFKEQRDKLEAKIQELASDDFFKRKVDLAVSILKENGIKDPEVLGFDFWDSKVDPAEFSQFLDKAISKDYVEKKKTN